MEALALWDRRRSSPPGVRDKWLCRVIDTGVLEYWNIGVLVLKAGIK